MGYVIRCSKTEAVHRKGQTYVNENPLHTGSEAEIADLKAKYKEENLTDNLSDYGDVYFSMNKGDYLRPNL
jgi:hypothetical protein